MTADNSPSTTPNSDIMNWPAPRGASADGAATGVSDGQEWAPLTPHEQIEQLSNYFEDNYPEVFASLTTDEGACYRGVTATGEVPAEVVANAERQWARTADLISHASLLVLGAGLDHAMPHVAFVGDGKVEVDPGDWLPELPEGIGAHVLKPGEEHTNVWGISLHGGPGWFGDGASHDQFWLPLFASIAGTGAANIIDVTYPLPGYGEWDATREAVAETFRLIRRYLPEGARLGVVAFGSGILAAADVLGDADFLVAMTPRLPGGAQPSIDNAQVPLLVSLADSDTRGTSTAEVRAWAEKHKKLGGEVTEQLWPSEHIIAAPAVWRERISAIGQWLRAL